MPPKKYKTPEEKTRAKSKQQWEYDRDHTTRVSIKLNDRTDADILEHLERLDNKQGYIKSLIREDNERTEDLPNTRRLS